MEPTIFSENVLLSEHITPRLKRIRRGDIIIARSPANPKQLICKRVTGLPGDTVTSGFSICTVPRGHVWLQGDNHGNSTDSRAYGPVPQALIRSRVLVRVWPLRDMTMFINDKT